VNGGVYEIKIVWKRERKSVGRGVGDEGVGRVGVERLD